MITEAFIRGGEKWESFSAVAIFPPVLCTFKKREKKKNESSWQTPEKETLARILL